MPSLLIKIKNQISTDLFSPEKTNIRGDLIGNFAVRRRLSQNVAIE